MLAEIIRRADSLPVDDASIEAAISQVRSEFLPIATEDAAWLSKVAQAGEASLDSMDRLQHLARFLDTHLVLCYRNGADWYDANPLILDELDKLI